MQRSIVNDSPCDAAYYFVQRSRAIEVQWEPALANFAEPFRSIEKMAHFSAPSKPPALLGRRLRVYLESGWATALILILVKIAWLLLDPRPMVYLGDSSSYLYHYFNNNYIPADRSFLYPMILRVLLKIHFSAYFLVLVQTGASLVAALVFVFSLRRYLAVRPWLALAAGILICSEPTQLMYERYIMTEVFGLLMFALYCCFVFRYLEKPDLHTLIYIQGAGILIYAFRFSFLLCLWSAVFLIPLLAAPALRRRAQNQKVFMGLLAKHLISSFLLAVLFHGIYQEIYGSLAHTPPAYQSSDGFFLCSALAPILASEDGPTPQTRQLLLEGKQYGLDVFARRGYQMYGSDGLAARLKQITPDLFSANQLARQIAVHALFRNPLGALKLGWQTYAFYFRPDLIAPILQGDEGFHPGNLPNLPAVARQLKLPGDFFYQFNLMKNVYSHCVPWFIFLSLSPLWLLLAWMVVPRRALFFLWSLSCLLLLSITVFATIPTYRYFHLFGPIVLLAGAMVAEWGISQ